MLFNLIVSLALTTSVQLADSMTDRVEYIKAEEVKIKYEQVQKNK